MAVLGGMTGGMKGPSVTLDRCSVCGVEKKRMHLNSERVPGVGTVYRCRAPECAKSKRPGERMQAEPFSPILPQE